MKRTTVISAVGAAALAAAATAGIADAAGSASAHARTARTHPRSNSGVQPGGSVQGGGPGAMHGFPSVHSVDVVLDKAGTAFITVTSDSGEIESVGEGTITIKEAVKGVTYRSETVTVPSGAAVTDEGKTSSLADLKAGEHVTVSSSSEATTVMAGSAAWQAAPAGAPQGAQRPPQGAPSGSGESGS